MSGHQKVRVYSVQLSTRTTARQVDAKIEEILEQANSESISQGDESRGRGVSIKVPPSMVRWTKATVPRAFMLCMRIKILRPLDGTSLCSGVLTGVDCGIFAALVEEHAG